MLIPIFLRLIGLIDLYSVEPYELIRPILSENLFFKTAAANEYLEGEVDVGIDFKAVGNSAAVAATA
jgi:hypothetical protein